MCSCENADTAKFCGECGRPLVEEVNQVKSKSTSIDSKKRKKVIIGAIIVAACLFAGIWMQGPINLVVPALFGDALAAERLGEKYFVEAETVPKDKYENYVKAVDWFDKAVRGGNVDAQGYLGYLYVNGCGVKKDDKQGLSLLEKSAIAESPVGCMYLGLYYCSKQGYDKLAFHWLGMAEKNSEKRSVLVQEQRQRIFAERDKLKGKGIKLDDMGSFLTMEDLKIGGISLGSKLSEIEASQGGATYKKQIVVPYFGGTKNIVVEEARYSLVTIVYTAPYNETKPFIEISTTNKSVATSRGIKVGNTEKEFLDKYGWTKARFNKGNQLVYSYRHKDAPRELSFTIDANSKVIQAISIDAWGI